jgi:oligopeptide transport system permease protein
MSRADSRLLFAEHPELFERVAKAQHLAATVATDSQVSYWGGVWQRLKSKPQALFGLVVLLFLLLAAAIGPLLWTLDPSRQFVSRISVPVLTGVERARLISQDANSQNAIVELDPVFDLVTEAAGNKVSPEEKITALFGLRVIRATTEAVDLQWCSSEFAEYALYRHFRAPRTEQDLGLPLSADIHHSLFSLPSSVATERGSETLHCYRFSDRLALKAQSYFYTVVQQTNVQQTNVLETGSSTSAVFDTKALNKSSLNTPRLQTIAVEAELAISEVDAQLSGLLSIPTYQNPNDDSDSTVLAASEALSPSVQIEKGLEFVVMPAHPLGTDHLGRDMLARTLHGLRVSLFIGIVAPLCFVVIGSIYGAFSGFIGGRADMWMMRFADFVIALPFLLFMILLKVLLGLQAGQSGIYPMIIAMVLLAWPGSARLVRGQVLQMRELAFVSNAQLMGASRAYIVRRHMFPNLFGLLLVSISFAIPSAIFTEAFLSFIGLGIVPPTPSLGAMCQEGLRTLLTHPHQLVIPAVCISLIVLAFNVLGDALRDALDVKETLHD